MAWPKPRLLSTVALLGAGAVWLARRELHYAPWMDDDAFISFRYARHLAEGQGLTFNPGERVEGYTNFLWTLLAACAHRLGADIPATARALGVALSFGALPFLFVGARRRTVGVAAGAGLACLPPLLLAVSESWAAWAVSGLENVLGACLVAAAFAAVFHGLESGRPSWFALGGHGFALATMTHPSYAVFAFACGVLLMVRALRHRDTRSQVIAFSGLFLAAYAPLEIWRLLYYGSPVPNTFYAKVGGTTDEVSRGFAYARDMARAYPVSFAAMALLPLLLAARRVRAWGPWMVWAGVAGYLGYIILIGGEAFPVFRLSVVWMPLAALMTLWCIQLLAAWLGPRPVRTVAAGLAALAVVAAGATAIRNRTIRLHDAAIENRLFDIVRGAALCLRAQLPADTYLAHSGAGMLAYYTDFEFLDTLGLTDAHIARSRVEGQGKGVAGHEKGDGWYVVSRQPSVVLFSGYPISSLRPHFKTDFELAASPDFLENYRPQSLPCEIVVPGRGAPQIFRIEMFRRVSRSTPSAGH
jgi:arabinofuranosyltransferase